MVSVSKLKVFIITYDDGETSQVLNVPFDLYYSNSAFRKNILHTKCLDCNVEFKFSEEQS